MCVGRLLLYPMWNRFVRYVDNKPGEPITVIANAVDHVKTRSPDSPCYDGSTLNLVLTLLCSSSRPVSSSERDLCVVTIYINAFRSACFSMIPVKNISADLYRRYVELSRERKVNQSSDHYQQFTVDGDHMWRFRGRTERSVDSGERSLLRPRVSMDMSCLRS